MRRTWWARLKSMSSTHSGAPKSNGRRRSRCANRGQLPIRSARVARRASRSGIGPSKTARPPIARLMRSSESSAPKKPASNVVKYSTARTPTAICNSQLQYPPWLSGDIRAKSPELQRPLAIDVGAQPFSWVTFGYAARGNRVWPKVPGGSGLHALAGAAVVPDYRGGDKCVCRKAAEP
jgi:hypothetical protein